MHYFHVIILLIVLRNAAAQSGSSGESVGADKVYTTKDILRAIEQEVEREHIGEGGSGSAAVEDIDDASSHNPNSLFAETHDDNPQPSSSRDSIPAPTRSSPTPSRVAADQDDDLSSPPKWDSGEGSESNDEEDQTEPPSDGPSGHGNKHPRMELAHFDKVAEVMKKLKKSKTDEEMAEKLRNGTESLGVSFKTFEQLSDLWISILRRIWRVWKAKGAKQVMHSIVNDMVTKTTQTVAPKLGNLVNRSLKSMSDKGTKMLNISYSPSTSNSKASKNTTENNSYQNNELIKVQVQPTGQKQVTKPTTQTRRPSKQEINKDSKKAEKIIPKLNSKEKKVKQSARNEAKIQQPKAVQSTVKVTVNPVQASKSTTHASKPVKTSSMSFKAKNMLASKTTQPNSTSSPIHKDSIGPKEPITAKISFFPRKFDTAAHHVTSKTAHHVTSKTAHHVTSKKQNNREKVKYSKKPRQKNIKYDVEIKAKLQAKKTIEKTKTKQTLKGKSKQQDNNKEDGKHIGKSTTKHKHETKKSLGGSSIKKEYVATTESESHEAIPQPIDHFEEVPGEAFEHRIDEVQGEVHRLENELTVMQTAVAGVIKRLTDLEKVTKDLSNITRTTVIMGAQQRILLPGNDTQVPIPDKKEKPIVVTETLPESEETPTEITEPVHENQEESIGVNETSPENSEISMQVSETPKENPEEEGVNNETPSESKTKSLQKSEEGFPANGGMSTTDEMPRQNITETSAWTAVKGTNPLIHPPVHNPEPFSYPDPFQIRDTFTEPIFVRYPPAPEVSQLSASQVRPKHSPHRVLIPLAAINGLRTQEEPTPNTLQQPIDNEMPPSVYTNKNNNIDDDNKQQDGMVKLHDEVMPKIAAEKVNVAEASHLKSSKTALVNTSSTGVSPTNLKKPSTTKYYIPESNHLVRIGPRGVAMEVPQGDQQSNEGRPIINIIVPNSETASLIQKEMCQSPCKNGGKCIGLNTCKCPSLFSGNHCEHFSLLDILRKNTRRQMAKRPSTRTVPKIAVEPRPYRPRRRHLSITDLLRLGAATAGYRLQNEREPITYEDQQGVVGGAVDESKKTIVGRRILTRTNPFTKRKQYILEI